MSSPTWTPDALASEAKPWRGRGWRLVEAQHRVSTLKLVDDLSEQALLEELLEGCEKAIDWLETQHSLIDSVTLPPVGVYLTAFDIMLIST